MLDIRYDNRSVSLLGAQKRIQKHYSQKRNFLLEYFNILSHKKTYSTKRNSVTNRKLSTKIVWQEISKRLKFRSQWGKSKRAMLQWNEQAREIKSMNVGILALEEQNCRVGRTRCWQEMPPKYSRRQYKHFLDNETDWIVGLREINSLNMPISRPFDQWLKVVRCWQL